MDAVQAAADPRASPFSHVRPHVLASGEPGKVAAAQKVGLQPGLNPDCHCGLLCCFEEKKQVLVLLLI
jgi:hypothetical protein